MKTTALNSIHKKEGAKMVSFAGFEMPIEFSGIKEEHMTVRNSVGVFDVSHMGEIWIKGEGALDLLKKISSNNPETLKIGEAQYSCFPNGKGGIVDDFISYYYEHNKYMLVVNASNIEKDFEWIKSQNEFGATVENSSDEISQLAIQGPKAIETVQKVTDFDVSSLKFYTFSTERFAGVEDVIISATGYTGAGGVEIYFKNKDAEHIYNVIMDAGKEFGIKPIGLAARDTLRLEMGYCLYGNDIDDTTSPIEAGLGWITKFNNNRQFVDRQFLEMQKKEGVSRRLRGFIMKGKAIPRKDYTIVDSEGNEIGVVTSGTMSPVLENGIGMGYLNKGYAAFGTQIFIKIRKRVIPAEVVKTPFI